VRTLVVFCHPLTDSFNAALLVSALAGLGVAVNVADPLAAADLRARCAATRGALELAAGADTVRLLDLYGIGFDPVLSAGERVSYLSDTAANIAAVSVHVECLQWAQALVLVFPLWHYGMPAMLSGWFDRVWLPGVSFDVPPAKGARARALMRHVETFAVVTSSGSPAWWLALIGNPCRRQLMRGTRALFARRCRKRWLQLHNMNNATEADRAKFLLRVQRALALQAA
jgi:NAD(P)H dehydrogenase (quinone)